MREKLIFLTIMFFCFTKIHSITSDAPGDSVKVILACATNDQNIVNNVKQNLRNDSLVQYVTFCPAHAVFLFQLSGDQQSAINYTNKIRKDNSLSESTLYIKGFDFADLLNFCPIEETPLKNKIKKK